MYCVGLTGTIASGKSTVAALFSTLGAHIISADQIAKQLTTKGSPSFVAIKSHFGPIILDEHGDLNRRLLRERIFQDPQQRLWLETLLHPQIRQQIQGEIQQCKGPYCMIEIPLLTDRTDYPYLNRVLLVLSTRSEQIQRIIHRDHCSREHAATVIDTQADEANYRAIADDILFNHGTVADIEQQVYDLHLSYLQKGVMLRA